jgi:squalene-hopene/tetraprenyl-beta-curcumene cyclase
VQNPDGSWSPLWFGNQDHPNEENLVYGTAKVLMAYRDLGLMDVPEARRGLAWLVANQNEDGGWGSGVWQMRNAEESRSAEHGARSGGDARRPEENEVQAASHAVLSTQYLIPNTPGELKSQNSKFKSEIQNLKSSVEDTALAVEALLAATDDPKVAQVVKNGLLWLIERVESGQHRQPAPIGFYFAKLWYYERLYPLTFTVAALGRACRQFARQNQSPDIPAETASSDAP